MSVLAGGSWPTAPAAWDLCLLAVPAAECCSAASSPQTEPYLRLAAAADLAKRRALQAQEQGLQFMQQAHTALEQAQPGRQIAAEVEARKVSGCWRAGCWRALGRLLDGERVLAAGLGQACLDGTHTAWLLVGRRPTCLRLASRHVDHLPTLMPTSTWVLPARLAVQVEEQLHQLHLERRQRERQQRMQPLAQQQLEEERAPAAATEEEEEEEEVVLISSSEEEEEAPEVLAGAVRRAGRGGAQGGRWSTVQCCCGSLVCRWVAPFVAWKRIPPYFRPCLVVPLQVSASMGPVPSASEAEEESEVSEQLERVGLEEK